MTQQTSLRRRASTWADWFQAVYSKSAIAHDRCQYVPATRDSLMIASTQWVAVLALTLNEQLLLTQDRCGHWVLPNDAIGAAEVPSQAARRILEGYVYVVPQSLTPLGRLTFAHEDTTDLIHLFLVRNLLAHDDLQCHVQHHNCTLIDLVLVWKQILRGVYDDAALQFGVLSAAAHHLL